MLMWLWKYLRGYVIIEVYGFSVERFMNLTANKGIYLWNLKRKGTKVTMAVSVKGFKLMKSCAKKTKCRIRVNGKIGLPFILYKYRKRKLFLYGIIFCCMILYLLTSFIWTIEVNGNKEISSSKIIEAINKEGCKVGTLKMKINCDKMEEIILKKYPEIAWISMEIKGTGLFVNVVESVKQPKIVNKSQMPCNIIADKECIIESIVTKTGMPLVKKGDVINKGEQLVSGKLQIKHDEENIETKYVHAEAEIIGKTYYEISDFINFKYIDKINTGNKKHEIYIKLGDKKFCLFHPRKLFVQYDKITQKKQFNFIKYKIPIEIITYTINEYTTEQKKYTDEEAKNILNKKINKLIENNFNNVTNIIDKKIEYNKTEEKLECKVFLTVFEKIGKSQIINKELTKESSE